MKLSMILVSIGLILSLSACCGGTATDKTAGECGAACDTTAVCSPINCSSADLAGIEKTLNLYVEAAVKGDSKIAEPAFAPGSTISYVEDGRLVTSPIKALFDYYDQTGPHPATYEITACDVADDVAIVAIDSRFGDTSFADMFTMGRDGDDWKIVSKIYHVK